jgi:hypothetical protein
MAVESKKEDLTNRHLNTFRRNPQDNKVLFDDKNGFNSKYFSEEPTFLSYSLFFDFSSPFFNKPDSVGESAERYFRRLKDTSRADMVVEFRSRLLHLIETTPYMLKDIAGMDNLLEYDRKEIYLERSLKINCYESLDLRIDNLAYLYTSIVWDWDKMKKTLPDNLEWVDFGIIITDFRDLVKYVGDEKKSIKPHLNARSYYFRNSKFNFRNSGFSSLNRTTLDMSSNSFAITCGKFENRSYIVNNYVTAGEVEPIGNSLEKLKVSNISPMTVGKPQQAYIKDKASGLSASQVSTKLKAEGERILKSGIDTATSLAKQEINGAIQRAIDIAKQEASMLANRNVLFGVNDESFTDLFNYGLNLTKNGNLGKSAKARVNNATDHYTGVVIENVLNKPKIGDPPPKPDEIPKKLLPKPDDVINKTVDNINSIIRKKLLKL